MYSVFAAAAANAPESSPPSAESVERLLRLTLQPDPQTYIRVVVAPQRTTYAETLLKFKYQNPSAQQQERR